MRLPFTSSELSVFRSGARMALNLLGIVLVILGIYWFSVWLERALTGGNEKEPFLPAYLMPWSNEKIDERPPLQFRQFPYHTELTSIDGRSVSALLIERPHPDRILFRRVSDNREFTVNLDELSVESGELVRSFPVAGQSITIPGFSSLVFPTLPIIGDQEFPHETQLTSLDGRSIEVTLLARPSQDEITFRRRSDGRVFTISVSQLVPKNRSLIQKFSLFGP